MISKKRYKKLGLGLSFALLFSCFSGMGKINVKAEGTLAQDLFISEYIEGSSNNKALELFNGTGNDLNLAGYKLELYSNGSTTVGSTLSLSGTLKNGEVYVIGNASAAATILSKSNITSVVTAFNGDDALVLKHNDIIIDSFGKVGERPVPAWGTGSNTTLDHTLIRKSTINKGDSNSTDSFDPTVE